MADHPFTRWGPVEQWGSGLRAATYDPRLPTNSSPLSAGVISLVEVFVPETFDCSKVILHVATAGSVLANAFAGVYDDQGNLLAQTADQSTPWTSTGNKEMALTKTVTLQGQRRYYVAMLVGSATTAPAMTRASGATLVNVGVAAPFRCATSGSGQTALPASIALAGVSAQNTAWWAGLA